METPDLVKLEAQASVSLTPDFTRQRFDLYFRTDCKTWHRPARSVDQLVHPLDSHQPMSVNVGNLSAETAANTQCNLL